MLTKQLRKSEKYNPNERKDYKTVPPKVEYFLANFGRSFTPVICQFQELGKKYKKKIVAVTAIRWMSQLQEYKCIRFLV